MSLACSSDGDIEYLDEVLDFNEELNEDQDFVEFSEHILSLEAAQKHNNTNENIFNVVSSSSSDSNNDSVPSSHQPIARSIQSIQQQKAFKKKRKHFVPNKHTSVSKNDIRRSYAQSYIDALNSGNIPIFKKTLQDMISPKDFVLLTRNVSCSGVYFLPSYVETHGLEAVTAFYEAFIKSTPDCAFELHSSLIRVFSDGTSSIICKYTMNATKVFALSGLEENGNQKVFLSVDVDSLNQKFGKLQLNAKVTTTVDDPLTGSSKEVDTDVKVSLGQVHKNKLKLAIFGTVNLHLNTDKKVIRIEFTMCDLNEQQSTKENETLEVDNFCEGAINKDDNVNN